MVRVLLKESVVFAWQSLTASKLRSFLSLLGITIGIFAIILVFTIVDSLENSIKGSLQSLGTNVVFIQKWPWAFGSDYPWWKYINRPTPQYEELELLKKQVTTTEALAYRMGARRSIKYKTNSIANAIVAGVSHEYYKINKFEIVNGRYFTQVEADNGYHVVILGHTLTENLFPNENPIGKHIKIAGFKATVIGTLKKEGESMLGASVDKQAYIPFNFARYLMDTKSENADPLIAAKAKPYISNQEMADEIIGIMRNIRRLKPKADDNFSLNETSLLSKNFDDLFGIIGLAGWIIGGFSILVGGFGIANIMFVSVKERTSLIGIQKSLGAKNYFILFQFLSESILLSSIGGGIGLLLTYLISFFGNSLIGMDVQLSAANVILGSSISVLIGIISGFVPAYSASQLDPVEAIRSN